MKAKDVKYIFEHNPELSQIGTKTQYFKYLKNKLKDSVEKNILYHATGTKRDKDNIIKNGFDFSKIKNKLRGDGLSVATTAEFTKGFGDYVIPLIVDAKNYESNLNIEMKNLDSTKFDLITDYRYGLIDAGVITSPEKIHILGSKKDKEDFQKFVSNNQSQSLESKVITGFFTLSFLAGLFLSISTMTGNVVRASSPNLNFAWPVLVIVGIFGFYVMRKYKK